MTFLLQPESRLRLVSRWPLLLLACAAMAACETQPPLPERPAAPVSAVALDAAIDHAVDDLLVQAQRLPEFQASPSSGLGGMLGKSPKAPVRIVVDSGVDGSTGQQTLTTRALDARLLARAAERFPMFQVEALSPTNPAAARFVLAPVLTPLERRQGKPGSYRINLSLSDSESGMVLAQAAARAIADTVDATPTNFYRDSPSLSKDRTVEGQIRTAEAPAGTAADGVYLANLPVVALIAEGARLYEAGQYTQALAVYETAAARVDGKHLRIYNGLYLSNMQLGRTDAAEKAFGRLVAQGIASNTLSVKFLFRPGGTDFWSDPKINSAYPMWVKVLAREIAVTRSCVTIAGHTSRSGPEQFNDRLSLQRASAIQKRLEIAAPETVGRLQSSGMGFRENLIGTGSDDASDALDRRVDFRVRNC